MKRRNFLKQQLAAGVGGLLLPAGLTASPRFEPNPELPAVPITSGPKQHWFGYYDKQQIDASGRYALGMEVDFEYRSPTADDVLGIGMVDLQDDHAGGLPRWIELGESRAWGWQQGCMLQWRPVGRDPV